MPAAQTTTLNRSWLLKIAIFLIIMAGFAGWGLLDATVFYPNRGEADAKLKLRDYLQASRDAGSLAQAKSLVQNPKAELATLAAKDSQLRSTAGPSTMSGRAAAMDLARLDYLRALQRLWKLDSAPARITDTPDKQLDELIAYWKTHGAPKPLSGLDLLFQWVFVAVGAAGALWLALILIRARAVKFGFDPAEHRLYLPAKAASAGAASIAPADVKEFDKRKWHKFFVTLILHDGRHIKLDLLRHVPLEAWILEMEKIAFPETAATEPPAEPAAPAEIPPAANPGGATS